MRRRTNLRGALALSLFAIVLASGCRPAASTVLVVTVTVSGSLPSVTTLSVMLVGSAGSSTKVYRQAGAPITFPTTFTAELPTRITGELAIDVSAEDASMAIVAHGRIDQLPIQPGSKQIVVVPLSCGGQTCAVDGGQADAPLATDGGLDGVDPSCGNGRIDVGETCDTAIAAGAPGACPPADCDDGIACTTDTVVGQGCQVRCVYREITARIAGDRCCPTGATSADDSDCSTTCGNGVVDVGETCDTGLAAGAPGACPTAATCMNDPDPCTSDALISGGTCAAICSHVPITEQSGTTTDGCCPVGAWNAVDSDCPALCGDGQLASDELCDPGLIPTAIDACPTSCDDGDPCTLDVLVGAGCQAHCVHAPITVMVAGDGCCPTGANHRTDPDCQPSCGNDVVEPGESCDGEPGTASACPSACGPSPSACLVNALVGDAASCTARCALTPVTACGASDGCCAAGCTAATDPDCSPTCGDGVVQTANGETCDTAIAAGQPGACPTACSDGLACTEDVLVSARTCAAACLLLPITEARAGDGCCPAGADETLDPDCAAVCGNGVVEAPTETCDYAAATGACPSTCPVPASDTCSNVRVEGTPGACSAACVAHPISTCVSGDGCCASGCTITNDADCPAVCGDGVLSPGETCDRAITAGMPGNCARTCDDGDACTTDWASGSIDGCTRACSHTTITACRTGDGCCPPGCSAAADHDCAPICGDGVLGAGETCDPPSTCPATCPDDGDPCTREVLVGDGARCTAVCQHVPVTTCSAETADFCCPTTCTSANDVDCPGTGSI
jgi:hypothetical protein